MVLEQERIVSLTNLKDFTSKLAMPHLLPAMTDSLRFQISKIDLESICVSFLCSTSTCFIISYSWSD